MSSNNAGAAQSAVGRTAAKERLSKADHVYNDLKEAILAGHLEPGAAIDKLAICDRLGVSRFPVTTAINRLAFERLVVIEPQHGSFVARISARAIREYMLIRRALESEIAGQAAGRLTSAEQEALSRNLRYQKAAASAKDRGGFYALDVEFHRIIIGSQGLDHASDILDGLRAHLERVRRLLLTPPGRLPKTCAEHALVARAILSADAAGAREAMRAHLDQTAKLFDSFVDTRPDLFVA